MTIAVVDYHKGNLLSVQRGLQAAGAQVAVTDRAGDIASARAIVLPGVGAFADAADALRRLGLDGLLRRRVAEGVPFLGICLGMHLMFEEGTEGAPEPDDETSTHNAVGLGILPGVVDRLPKADAAGTLYKVPHVGWNTVSLAGEGGSSQALPLFDGIPDGEYFYFTHSYAVPDGPFVVGRTCHSVRFPSAVRYGDRAFGVQFHPEKSSDAGHRLLQNFVSLAQEG